VANNREWRVPDITCYDRAGTTKYIIDTRIAWKLHNDNGNAVGSYTPCKLARDGEREKRARWDDVVSAHRNFTEGATFVLFSVEIAGGFGPQAERFVETVVEWAGNVRDVSVFGWQAANFDDFGCSRSEFCWCTSARRSDRLLRRATGRGLLGARTPWAGWSLVRSK
jgi:hypothetical protein